MQFIYALDNTKQVRFVPHQVAVKICGWKILVFRGGVCKSIAVRRGLDFNGEVTTVYPRRSTAVP